MQGHLAILARWYCLWRASFLAPGSLLPRAVASMQLGASPKKCKQCSGLSFGLAEPHPPQAVDCLPRSGQCGELLLVAAGMAEIQVEL